MKLMRITPFGLAELRKYATAHGTLPPPELVTEYWSEPHPLEFEVGDLAERVGNWLSGTRIDDAELAIQLHQTLRLPRRVAADRMVWPWLAAIAFPEYTLRRYPGAQISLARFGTEVHKNALGRLWWGAELCRVDRPRETCEAVGLRCYDDPYVFLRFLFEHQTVHEELTIRTDLLDRAKLVSMLAYIHHRKPDRAALRNIARDATLLSSTLLFDALEVESSAEPYAVDPAACAEVLELLSRELGAVPSAVP